MSAVLRVLHAMVPTVLVVAIVAPTLPGDRFGPLPGWIGRALLTISVKQNWGMYAPDPQRAQVYMDLEAEYADGTTAPLLESDDVRDGWGSTWEWRKTRLDIWRFYANFHSDGRNDNRSWYLRAVCVREARAGKLPRKIAMYQVKRRFAAPEAVRAGKPGLGEPDRRLVTVQYCGTEPTRTMIERDREQHPELHG
jgi:hypothetical protein